MCCSSACAAEYVCKRLEKGGEEVSSNKDFYDKKFFKIVSSHAELQKML